MLKKQNQKGFTIIEVLIVLAIAAVILLVVFLAVPALQRNNRNTQRRSDVSHLGGIINEAITNNGGTIPTAAISLGNEKFTTGFTPTTAASGTTPASMTISALPATLPTTATIDTPVVYSGAKCSSQTAIAVGTARQVAIWYAVESNAGAATAQCQEI
jgi:prepilin-type N-terminal cleavage/methylation domain-containing protein